MNSKNRLDQELVRRVLTSTRSQSENYIKLGSVTVNGRIITKPGYLVSEADKIKLNTNEIYVSRAGLKLASVVRALKLDFKDKLVLDVGSSTGGFTELALRNGARKVIAVDVGTDQMHPSISQDDRVELHEKTDIRAFKTTQKIDLVVADVSFISLREILPYVTELCSPETDIVVMVKPQFEAGSELRHKGVIKNDKIRRNILKDFENWTQKLFKILEKADSEVPGAKGNRERFYLLKKLN